MDDVVAPVPAVCDECGSALIRHCSSCRGVYCPACDE